MNVTTASGKCYMLNTNREIAKFTLFVAPKLVAAGDKITSPMPRLEMTDEVNRLAKINSQLRMTKARRAQESIPFDDGIPF